MAPQVLNRKGKSVGTSAASSARRAGPASRVLRIVGGEWRSRRWRFPQGVDIRPTPDRVRETLFNWLAPHLGGARCLDLCAGSGALGLEALSRGAAECVFIERDRTAARAIRDVVAEWGATGATVTAMDALRFLDGEPRRFDIVFLDPPFASGLLPKFFARLAAPGATGDAAWLARKAWIYAENSARDPLPPLPRGWQLVRTGKAGEVGYHLLAYELTDDSTGGA